MVAALGSPRRGKTQGFLPPAGDSTPLVCRVSRDVEPGGVNNGSAGLGRAHQLDGMDACTDHCETGDGE